MSKTFKVVLITLISFGVYFFLSESYFKNLRALVNEYINQFGVSHIISYAVLGVPIFLGVLFLNNKVDFIKSLGLRKSFFQGAGIALLCTMPMFIGYAVLFDFDSTISWDAILVSVIAAGFFEELYFRGFLFGQIFRLSRLGFVSSVFFGALLFGLAHLYQGTGYSQTLGIFLVTFLGGILFAWVYVEWNFNLWVSIFLHLFMNLSWELFTVSDNALGGVYSNVFRIITIVSIIVITIVYNRRGGGQLKINRGTIWMKNR